MSGQLEGLDLPEKPSATNATQPSKGIGRQDNASETHGSDSFSPELTRASEIPSPHLKTITEFARYQLTATSEHSLLHHLAMAVSKVADLSWVGLWFVNVTAEHVQCSDQIGFSKEPALAHTISVSDSRVASLLALSGPTLLDTDFTPSSNPTWLAAPIRLADGPRGFLIGNRNGAPLTFTSSEIDMVELLLTMAAVPTRVNTPGRTDGLAQFSLDRMVELISEPTAAIDETGEIRAYNAGLRDLFDLAPSTPPGNIIELIRASERQAHMGPKADGIALGAKRLNTRLQEGGAIDVPITLTVLANASASDYLVSLRPVSTPDMEGQASFIVTFKQPHRPDWTDDETQVRTHLAQMEVSAARAASMARLSQAVNSGIGLNDVLQVAIERLTMLLDGQHGVIVLRAPNGDYVGHAQIGFGEHAIDDLVLTEEGAPTTAIAIRAQRPIYYTYEDATTSEREIFDQLGFRAATIAPLFLDNEVIGVAYVNFTGAHRVPTGEDLRYAAALADQCAVAIGRTRLMERWEAAHRRLLTVIDQLPQGVVIVDSEDGKLILANRAAESLWGVSLSGAAQTATGTVTDLLNAERYGPWPFQVSADRSDASNANVLSALLPIADSEGTPFPAGETPLERTLRTGEGRLGEPLIILRSDGNVVSVVGNHVPIFDTQGRITGAVGVLQDVAQLKELDRAKDEFLSVVAHELRNPLTSLRGNMQLLTRRIRRQNDPARQDEIDRLEGIVTQVDRIGELVTRLLDVSRADLGRLDLSLSDSDATAVINAAVQTAKGLSKQHRFIVNMPETFPVKWDVLRIEQVIQNLLSNAVKYAVPGNIEVTLSPHNDDGFSIVIQDQGPGIPDSAKVRLFERYYRANHESEHAKDAEGLGIGLYISHKIIAAHGGTLTVTDSPEGGSVFTITLPITSKQNGTHTGSSGTARPDLAHCND